MSDDFMRKLLARIAGSLDVPYDELVKDFPAPNPPHRWPGDRKATWVDPVKGDHDGAGLYAQAVARALNPPVDSREGITAIFEWARSGGWVLNEAHERIALKHGVDTAGVTISRPIPFQPRKP